MENCLTCKHAIFNERWGEYKCAELHHTVYIPLDPSECKFYKEGTPKESLEKNDEKEEV